MSQTTVMIGLTPALTFGVGYAASNTLTRLQLDHALFLQTKAYEVFL